MRGEYSFYRCSLKTTGYAITTNVSTSIPINSDAHVDEGGKNVFFSFDIGLAVNTETEITLSQLEEEVFSLERSIMDFQQAGPI